MIGHMTTELVMIYDQWRNMSSMIETLRIDDEDFMTACVVEGDRNDNLSCPLSRECYAWRLLGRAKLPARKE